MQFNVQNGMTDEEPGSVKRVLDQLVASPLDGDGYRDFSTANGTRARIGGFIEGPEASGAGVRGPADRAHRRNGVRDARGRAWFCQLLSPVNLFIGKLRLIPTVEGDNVRR